MAIEPMRHTERYAAVMAGQPVDRLPRIEWAGWWGETLEAWREQGLDPALARGGEPLYRHFGLDYYQRLWYRALSRTAPRPAVRNSPLIHDRDSYLAFREAGHVFMDPDVMIDADERARLRAFAQRQDAGEMMTWLSFDGFFWVPRTLFGIEPHFYAFYDQPELMHQMNRDNLAHQLALLDRIGQVLATPMFVISEDMSYNHGPMLSRELFDEFLAPYYRRLVAAARERNMTVIIDSDGDVTTMIPWLESAGVGGVLPLERQAGVDVVAIRQKHRAFEMIGAFDKMVMPGGEAAMRAEFERLGPLMRAGRFIPSVDHQTPPHVSLDNYRLYVRLLKEYSAVTP